MKTIVVFGDQLNRSIGALQGADPDAAQILMVESETLLGAGRHVQRSHLVITAMRRFAEELRGRGFEVDVRRAATLQAGIEAHIDSQDPVEIVATEPNSRRARRLCEELGIEQLRSNQFLCHHDEFASWAEGKDQLRMENFYRWTRQRHGYLMDGEEPAGGTWNLDSENREPPPRDPSIFATPASSTLNDLDREVLDSLPASHGAPPTGTWATSRRAALARLRHFLENELHRFGPYEDTMTSGSWNLAHSMLSPYLNLGLLLPGEVCDAVEQKYRTEEIPLNSAEGFIRQIIGWREYVWGLYWLWPDHRDLNELDHHRPLPPAFSGDAPTQMRCLSETLEGLQERAWVHHIPRLMVLSNLSNLYGARPRHVIDWMTNNYVDGAEWVMVPNVIGMGLWADGGRMATKPYVSGGAYINRMSDYCSNCRYDPKQRVGDDACPFTTLYWDFVARHEERLSGNNRMARPLANMKRLSNLDEVRKHAETVIQGLRDGHI